jgi:DNA mismatch repair protein MutL
MPTIKKLPPHIVAKIAAGEVIERPSFAVKELIENAIDAHADSIHIAVEEAGLKKIVITDNGDGMGKEDLLESTKPHTTSKLTADDNLIGIKTLGFRGEALSIITAFSDVTIKSKLAKDIGGNQITVTDGKVSTITPVGMPKGTVVIVENLFSLFPVRKKFLKTPQTEFSHIFETVLNYALAFPHIRFTLTHNKKIIFDVSQTTKHIDRIQLLLGKHISSSLLPFSLEENYINISGFLAKPEVSSRNQKKQFIFVNGRKITDRLISFVLKDAYGNLLEKTVYPVVILFLRIPYEMVDVNIHPRKEQINFFNRTDICAYVKKIVSQTLKEHNLTFHNISSMRITNSFAGNFLRETVLKKESLTPIPSSSIIQVHNLYFVTQTKDGLLLIDQHAAHERILFEKLKKAFLVKQQTVTTHKLSKPISLTFSLYESSLLANHYSLFKTLGFRIQKNRKQYILTHVPFLFHDRNPQELLLHLLENTESYIPPQKIDHISEAMLSYLACRASIKSGDTVTFDQMKKIIEELEQTTNNATCPHGRPTKIVFPLISIHSLFKR